MTDTSKHPKELYTKEGSHYKCKLCDYIGSQGNVIRHINKHKDVNVVKKAYHKQAKPSLEEKEGNSIFVHMLENGKLSPIPQSTVTLLAWKTKHNIPLAAIDDNLFKNYIAAHPEGVLSPHIMRTIEKEITEQIISSKKIL